MCRIPLLGGAGIEFVRRGWLAALRLSSLLDRGKKRELRPMTEALRG